MEFFLNDLSFQAQFHSSGEFSDAVKKLVSILAKLAENNRTKVFKDSILTERAVVQNEHFLSSFEKIDRDIKQLFRRFLFDRNNPIEWRASQVHLTSDQYFCDCVETTVSDTTVAEAAARQLADDGKRVLINLENSSFCNPSTLVTRNNSAKASVICIEEDNELLDLLEGAIKPIDHFLKQNGLFKKTHFKVQGRTIYERVEDGEYWYLDNLHKTHFEVFSRQKRHLGEATLEGILDTSKRDASKDYKLPF